MFTLAIFCLTTSNFTLTHGPNIPGSYAILFFTALVFTSMTSHIHNWALFSLWLHLFILSGIISPLISSGIFGTYQAGGVHLSISYLFAFSYCSWSVQGKNLEVVCHSLLQCTMFCQKSLLWPLHLGWPYMAWLIVSLSYTRCDPIQRQVLTSWNPGPSSGKNIHLRVSQCCI